VGIALENMFHAKAAKGRRVGGMGVCLRILRGFAAKVFHKRREGKKAKRRSFPAKPEEKIWGDCATILAGIYRWKSGTPSLSFFPFYLL
jgi:hypothetical protein